tara:strand:- start:228 stop:407 length:180 start_codon:yes stop_codon:yes gene_type:complete
VNEPKYFLGITDSVCADADVVNIIITYITVKNNQFVKSISKKKSTHIWMLFYFKEYIAF